MPVESRAYGKLSSGEEVTAYTLSNGSLTAEVLTYGAVSWGVRFQWCFGHEAASLRAQ